MLEGNAFRELQIALSWWCQAGLGWWVCGAVLGGNAFRELQIAMEVTETRDFRGKVLRK